MNKVAIYIHGKGGNAEEAEFYKDAFKDYDVVGLEYISQNPWEAKEEFTILINNIVEKYDSAIVIANSIGAYYLMNTTINNKIKEAYFISPIVDMEKLITDMMKWANVTEKELEEKEIIHTTFGEDLSWKYLTYVRDHKINWKTPTHILYGEKDNLTSIETITEFVKQHNASLTIMKDGEHWFHTPEQMAFIKQWIEEKVV